MPIPSLGRASLIACGSLVAVSMAAAVSPAAGQAPAAVPPARLDFRAFTENGQPVGDLKTDELTLKVNGKLRPIGALTVYQSLPPDTSAGSAPALPLPYSTNVDSHHGRVIYVLADDDSIAAGHEGPLKDALRLLTTELGPDDRIGLVDTVGLINIRPSTDISKVRVVADSLVGKALTRETEADAACRTTHVLGTLDTMLALTGDTPTTLMVFSAGLTGPSAAAVTLKGTKSASLVGTCPIQTEDFQRLASAAASASVDLYLFSVTEGRGTHSDAQDAGFQSLAGATGAEYVSLSGSAEGAVARVLRETSAYYEANFVPDAANLGAPRLRVELRSTRPGVKVRARPAVDVVRTSAAGPAVSPKEMLRTATVFRDLPLRAAGFVSRNPGSDEVKVVAMFEGADPTATLTSASVGLFDEHGTLKKQWTAQPGDLAKRPVMAAVGAAPGAYRMRVAAVDSTGRTGTADYDMQAEIPRADPLKLSALILGTQQKGGGLAPRMDFSTEPIAIGYLEIYNVPTGGTVTVDLDIAQTSDGAALATAPTNVNPASAPDARIAFGGFDISGMRPGDYLVRAVVSLDGKPVGKVVRTLRKTE